MIGNIKNTKSILGKYQLRAKKNFGQNFLVDENILMKIVEAAGPDLETGVLEIGPGIGALTEVLLQNFCKVLAFEIDNNLFSLLEEELKEYKNLKLVNKDFLKVDLEKEFEYFSDCKRVIVVSNLPYYITTQIILRFLEEDYRIEELFFMVQKEVAERLVAEKGTKDYGSLSVLMKYRSDAEILFHVSRNCFLPRPNVDSAVIKLKKRKVDLGIKNENQFLKFIRNIFTQRRKTLVNNLLQTYGFSREKIYELLRDGGINENVRSEALSLEKIAEIYKGIFEAPN
jgi:16S rRNA (adenine1518-N6/adenine1519-N6)-dimethyltransferase